jgi:hypothetical protein
LKGGSSELQQGPAPAIYGEAAKLTPEPAHSSSLAVLEGALSQTSGHLIRLKHVFVDITAAA